MWLAELGIGSVIVVWVLVIWLTAWGFGNVFNSIAANDLGKSMD